MWRDGEGRLNPFNQTEDPDPMKQPLSIAVIVTVSALCATTGFNALAATARPKLAITAPKPGLQVSNEMFDVTGRTPAAWAFPMSGAG